MIMIRRARRECAVQAMTTTFYFIRHGTCEPVGKRIAGRAPGVHLNEEGWRQVRSLAADFSTRYEISGIYSSPLERTMETAGALSEHTGLPVVPRDGLMEVDFGDWTGLTFEELGKLQRWKEYNLFRSGIQIPGGESIPQVQARVLAELQHLRTRHPGQGVAIVAHGDVIKAAVTHFAGAPLDFLLRFEISPASLSIVDVADWGVKIHLINRV